MSDKDVKNEDIESKVEKQVENTEEKALEESVQEESFAKAGKRSKKQVEAAKAEEERQARKEERKAEEAKGEIKAGPKPITRSRLERRGKKYQEVHKKIEKNKTYPLAEAVKLAIETSPVKFDATLEMHFYSCSRVCST